jgi:hypothetical protein
MLVVSITGDGLQRFTQLSSELGSAKAKGIYNRAINDTGAKAATATGRALSDQSGVSAHAMARLIAGSTIAGGGHAVISGTVNMLRLRSVPGTEAFDAGSIYVRWR